VAFFQLSKILGLLLDPFNVLYGLLVVVMILLWRDRSVWARRLLVLTVLALTAVIVLPIGDWLLAPLENRFPQLGTLPAKVDGIIMLGGAQEPRLTKAHGQPAMNSHAERMTTFLAMARQYPDAKVVFSGGSGDLLHQDVNEGETVRLFLTQQGFDPTRVLYESRSRNTYENVLLSKDLVKPRPGDVWLVVGSAADLPRTVGIFRRLDWPVTAVPCDYRALPPEFFPSLSLSDNLLNIRAALHEWIGLVVYYLTGKCASVFPAPEERS
jgi:uncharacterized SAM-binding protein YcdF (DUF218 family)